jgi:hypothetical protein
MPLKKKRGTLKGPRFERYPERQIVEPGIISEIKDDGTLVVIARTGWKADAFPITPSKNIGIGYEVGDNILLYSDYDGNVYALGFIPAVIDEDRSMSHPAQATPEDGPLRPNDTVITDTLDPNVSGISNLSGKVCRMNSGDVAQSFSTPSKNKHVAVFENYALDANAGHLNFNTDAIGRISTELSGRTVAIPLPSGLASKIRFDESGITISLDHLKKLPGAKESIEGPKSEIKIDSVTGNISVKAFGPEVTIESLLNIQLIAPLLIELKSLFVDLAGGSVPVARIGDRVATPEGPGVIVSGSWRTGSS